MTLAQKQPPIPLPRIAHDPVPDLAGIPVLTAAALDFLGELQGHWPGSFLHQDSTHACTCSPVFDSHATTSQQPC